MPWHAKWTNLPKYKSGVEIDYVVREITELQEYTVTYVQGNYALTGQSITNTEISINLDLVKVDQNDSEKKLTGAVFTIDKLNEEENGAEKLPSTTANKTTAGEGGTLTFTGLTAGHYVIQEITAPAGYLISPVSTFYIRVSGGAVYIVDKDDTKKPSEWTASTPVDGGISLTAASDAQPNPSVTVPNPPGVELPSTGGSGTLIYTVAGIFLITLAGVLLVSRKRKANR